jgi:hypothetical protein
MNEQTVNLWRIIMESIRILQNTYEKLYALTPVLKKFIQTEYDKLDKLQKQKIFKFSNITQHQDIYYHLRFLIENWNILKLNSKTKFFTEENYRLFVDESGTSKSVYRIRNSVMHPDASEYSIDIYKGWNNTLEEAAKQLNSDLRELMIKLHEKEKNRLLTLIKSEVTTPAINSGKLDEETLKSIIDTEKRLESQLTAAGIVAFFEDALRADNGKNIGKILEDNDLKSFEKIKDDVLAKYFGEIL